ncbi:hypothetical protein PMZ80_009276 [Knufia obscura]|uniref:BTB domain-containing protein n=2 Tax=Knufia TaxID=430999 RepID=A0AAN8FCH0_9EURO|nr:hypothetical protein PMZ80_009276 [Knufia obscura]KAK5955736.1 hypothetical protein OHC33_003377 [Knufia fluminis]
MISKRPLSLDVHQLTVISYSQSSVVAIIAGSEKKKYYVHKTLLRQESSFYYSRLSGVFADNDEEVSLVQEGCDVVEAMVDYIYRRYRPTTRWAEVDHSHYAQCYRLADEKLMCGFKNMVMDKLRSAYRKARPLVDMKDVEEQYALGIGHTDLAKFLVKLVVYAMMNKSATYAASDQPDIRVVVDDKWEGALENACMNNQDLAVAVLREVMQYRANEYGPAWECSGKCLFHDHTDHSSCPTNSA